MADIDHLSRGRLPIYLDQAYQKNTSDQLDVNDLFKLLSPEVDEPAGSLSDHSALLLQVMEAVAKALRAE
jgi:hypothetical protein